MANRDVSSYALVTSVSSSVEFAGVFFLDSSVVVTAFLVHKVVCSDLRHGIRLGSRKHQVPIHTRMVAEPLFRPWKRDWWLWRMKYWWQSDSLGKRLRQLSKRWDQRDRLGSEPLSREFLSTREESENLLRSVATSIRTVSPKECLGHSGASSSAVTVEPWILAQHDCCSKWRRKWRIQQWLTTLQ